MVRKHNTSVDVLFINPPSPDRFVYIRDINRHGRSSWERMIWPQTNLAYLAAVAEQLGLSVDIIDCIAENIKWPAFEDILRICQPRYCFSNIISATYSNDVKALCRSKEISKVITVGMGPHLTDSPGRSIEESEGLDFVICHEAELTLKELLEVLERYKSPSIERLSNIHGIAFIPGRLIPGASLCIIFRIRFIIEFFTCCRSCFFSAGVGLKMFRRRFKDPSEQKSAIMFCRVDISL